MSKLGFLLELSIRELKRSVKINVLVILSLALGMYLPILSLADINVFFQNRKNLYPKISQDAWYCSVQSEHLTEAAYAHLKESLHLDRVGGCEKRSDNIRIADKLVPDALCVISEDFFDFARCDLLEGENIWESGGAALTKRCMVEESFPAKYGVRAEVGDSLEVNGETYQIAGFFRSMELIGKVLVPLEGFQEKGFDQKNYYTLFVQDTASGGEALLQAKLQEHLYQVNYVDGIDRYYERTRKRCTANSLAIFLVTVPITLFSIVNCILILYGKVIRTKRETGIKIAMGAKKGDIFLSCFFETSLLALVAYLLDILCMPLLVRTVPPDFLLIFDFSVYALGFLVLEVMCLVIGRSVGRKMAKLDIVSVLRGD